MKAFADLEAWLVVGSQDLYGDEALAQVAEDVGRVAAALDGDEQLPIRVVAKPVLKSADSILRLVDQANSSDQCVGLIAWMHTFSPAKMWIAGLGALRKPLAHLHTQFNRDLPWSDIDMAFMNLHQSAHGDREFGHIVTRMGRPRSVIAGHWQDPAVAGRLDRWARAAVALHDGRRLRLVRFGDNMRQVAVTEGDKVEAQIVLGAEVNTYAVTELAAAVQQVPDSQVKQLTSAYGDAYRLDPSLEPGAERHDSLRDAARMEIAIRQFLDQRGATAFTDTFEDLGDLPHLPGIGVQRLMADGYGFGAEGDWKTAILVRLLKTMARRKPGGTSFMEDYTYHLAPDGMAVLGAHMLEVCPSIAADTPSCEIHPLSIGGKPDPVRLVFDAKPGRAVIVGMADLGDRLRLVANRVQVIDPPAKLPRLPVARAVWRPEPDLATAAEAWILSGAPHHTAFSSALDLDDIIELAELAGLELLTIDAATTIGDVRKELRWNQAHYAR